MENKEIQKHNLRTWIEISHQALKNNYDIFRGHVGSKCLLMAVVKSNTYGHSLQDFSREIQKSYQKKIKLQPVLVWETIVDSIKKLAPNSKVGYDLTEELSYPSKIAVLSIGYWYGFSRSLSSIGRVLIRGQVAKVIGRVSMDMISVDVTNI